VVHTKHLIHHGARSGLPKTSHLNDFPYLPPGYVLSSSGNYHQYPVVLSVFFFKLSYLW